MKTPIALIFFNRPNVLKAVFETIKVIKPEVLFLIQDGPRKEMWDYDLQKMEECREIVNDITWECKVLKNYSDENLGCGERVFSGISWAFSTTDRLIILEDDCLPSQGFFLFCDELLERFKNDDRIGMISGMNHLGCFEKNPADYLFATVGSIWGWATWKRSWGKIDFQLKCFDDANNLRLLKNLFLRNRVPLDLLYKGIKIRKQIKNNVKQSSWSLQRGIFDILNNALVVVPKYNLMSNIGLTTDSVHSVDDIKKIPRGLRPLYELKLYELPFPIKHPEFVIEDVEYNIMANRIMGSNKITKLLRRVESLVYRIIYGDWTSLKKGLEGAIYKRVKPN